MKQFDRQLRTDILFDLGLDHTQVAIYSNLIDFAKHPNVKHRTFNGKDAILYNYKHFAANDPLLNSKYKDSSEENNKRRLKKHLDFICDTKLLTRHQQKTTNGTLVYFEIDWNKYYELRGIEIPEDDQLEEDESTVDSAPTFSGTPKAPPLCHLPDEVGANKHLPEKVGAINNSQSINSQSVNCEDHAKNQETPSKEKTDGQTDGQNDLIKSYMLNFNCPRDFVLKQIDKLKAERERRRNKGLESIANERLYLEKMLADKDSLTLFLAESEVGEERKPTVRGYKTQEDNALKDKQEEIKKADIQTEDENRRNDNEFHEMMQRPDCELYKKCFDSLVDYAKQVVEKGENNALIEISMYSAYKKLTRGFKQVG